jgi:glucan phosphoethanolaminetransferase (alkaline phosphatase superfamily)
VQFERKTRTIVKPWWAIPLKLVWGAYLLLTSLYALLAYLPYTYCALIKAPAYEWIPWFVRHHAALYWPALLAATLAYWPSEKSRPHYLLFGLLAVAGLGISLWPFMPGLENDQSAYNWALAALLPAALLAASDLKRLARAAGDEKELCLLNYSNAVMVASVAALVYAAAAKINGYVEARSVSFRAADVELTLWSVISHSLVAMLVLSILNLIRIAASRMGHPRTARLCLVGLLVFAGLWTMLFRFLASALSFEGWRANLYAAVLAVVLTLVGFSLVSSRSTVGAPASSRGFPHQLLIVAACAAMTLVALALPATMKGGDWDGLLERTFTLVFWICLSLSLYALRPRRESYAVSTILGVLLLSAVSYKTLQATEIFWAKPLGATDDDIGRSFETYALHNASFELVHNLLGNARNYPCANLCRIMREYTNVRDQQAKVDVQLVAHLTPTNSERPSIFIFVIDSLRPDYLGAYNPRVDFSPSLDQFARDSIVIHNAYTQYSGTTLSEPAIWSGAMLLHTHYLQPFRRINSLEKLARADNYQMVISYDTVLSQILSPEDNLIKLDTDKTLWNYFEACSTIEQLEHVLDSPRDRARPVFFYAQPMNVHQFARNANPPPSPENWRTRQDFNNRIAYEVHQVDRCMGDFFTYLKSRGQYDNSVIILTSDHGDATGELGRGSHSLTIYPEIVRVPLIVHLPKNARSRLVYDDSRLSALTDIAPSLYYLLGHRPIVANAMYGHPLFAETRQELHSYQRDELFLASDVRAVYGILTGDGRYLYVAYDSPARSVLFDLVKDPDAEHNILTNTLKQDYDERIIDHLHAVADFYGYRPGMGSLVASAH